MDAHSRETVHQSYLLNHTSRFESGTSILYRVKTISRPSAAAMTGTVIKLTKMIADLLGLVGRNVGLVRFRQFLG